VPVYTQSWSSHTQSSSPSLTQRHLLFPWVFLLGMTFSSTRFKWEKYSCRCRWDLNKSALACVLCAAQHVSCVLTRFTFYLAFGSNLCSMHILPVMPVMEADISVIFCRIPFRFRWLWANKTLGKLKPDHRGLSFNFDLLL